MPCYWNLWCILFNFLKFLSKCVLPYLYRNFIDLLCVVYEVSTKCCDGKMDWIIWSRAWYTQKQEQMDDEIMFFHFMSVWMSSSDKYTFWNTITEHSSDKPSFPVGDSDALLWHELCIEGGDCETRWAIDGRLWSRHRQTMCCLDTFSHTRPRVALHT